MFESRGGNIAHNGKGLCDGGAKKIQIFLLIYESGKMYTSSTDNIHPRYCKTHVICSAFMSLVLKYAGVGEENLFFFWRRGKEGREKLFCKLGFTAGFSGLQMCFFLCGWFILLTF